MIFVGTSVNFQYDEARSGRAANDLSNQEYEAKIRGESWTTASSPYPDVC